MWRPRGQHNSVQGSYEHFLLKYLVSFIGYGHSRFVRIILIVKNITENTYQKIMRLQIDKLWIIILVNYGKLWIIYNG